MICWLILLVLFWPLAGVLLRLLLPLACLLLCLCGIVVVVLLARDGVIPGQPLLTISTILIVSGLSRLSGR